MFSIRYQNLTMREAVMLNSTEVTDLVSTKQSAKILNIHHKDLDLTKIDDLLDTNRYEECYKLLSEAALKYPDMHGIYIRLSKLYRSWIPRWHFGMLNDQQRNQAFADAISKTNLNNKTILDIGAGSGLLSMLAAQQNVKHIYSCEAIPPIAFKAQDIISKNGFADRITIIPKASFELKVGEDLPHKADVLISEIIDCGFIGEGFISALYHARTNLLTKDAILLPRKFSLKGYIIESEDIMRLNYINNVHGFDISDFNEFSTKGYFPVRLNTWCHSFLSNELNLVDINLYDYNFQRVESEVGLEINNSGRAHGLVFWFDVELIPGISITNSYENVKSHWMQAFIGFNEAIDVNKDDKLSLRFVMDAESINIDLMNDKKAFCPSLIK